MKEPKARWTIAFLRALVRTGEVRAAAEDAGIDHTTAYARRKTHPEFDGLWRGALVAHEMWEKVKEEEAIAALQRCPSTIASLGPSSSRHAPGMPASSAPPPSAGIPPALADRRSLEARSARTREELVGAGSQVKRAGHDRWSQAKEKCSSTSWRRRRT